MNMIEPCCAERQLAQLLRETARHAVMFQTNGDVTATHFIKDTMLLAGDRPRTLTIAADTLPVEAMRLVARYARLGYIAALRLMIPQTEDISGMIAGIACPVEVAVIPEGVTVPALMIWSGTPNTVVIQGVMPDVTTPALHLYTGLLCGCNSLTLRSATDAFEALFRSRRTDVTKNDAPDPAPKKKTTRKKSSKGAGEK